MNRERNYYNYGEFGYIMRHYRNRRTVRQRRQISYQNDGRYFKWGYVKKSDGKD